MEFCRVLLGHVRAGIGYAAILACMIFAALTGAAVVTISAIGGIMLPIMIKEGYDASDSTACVCAGSITGPIIPPSLPMVIFGVLSGASVTRMFIGGVVPGVITGLVCMLAWYFMNKNKNYALMPKATPREVWTAFKKAFPALMMPVIMMGGILSGIFTPTEAAVVAIFYTILVGIFIHKELTLKSFMASLKTTSWLTGRVLVLVFTATAFGYLLTSYRIPVEIANWILSFTNNVNLVWFFVVILLLFLGMFMETLAIIMLVTPEGTIAGLEGMDV